VALALVLLVGSGLLARSVWRLRSVDPGFVPDRTTSFRIALPPATYPTADRAVRFYDRAIESFASIGGVQDVGAVSKLPLDEQGRTDSAVFVEDRPVPSGSLPGIHLVAYASPAYFAAAGIRFDDGRTFRPDDPPRTVLEAIVSRSFAERYWARESPIGKRLRIITNGPWYTVVGVVADVKASALNRPVDQMVYVPLLPPANDPRWMPRDLAIVIRMTGEGSGVVPGIRDALRRLDPSLPIYRVRTLGEVVAQASARSVVTLFLIGSASIVALLLGAIGLYGVMSYVVSLRIYEVGIRLALGAQPREVRRLISRHGLAIAAVGIAIGLAGALALSRLLAALLYEVGPRDPVVLVAAATLVLVVSVVASWLPARRAAAVDPALALRAE
jgi:predicted permease